MKSIKLMLALIALIVVSSCTPTIYSKPDRNPVNLSYEQQVTTVHIRNMDAIVPEDGNPYDDEIISGPDYKIIKHGGWVAVKQEKNSDDLEISVEENTSSESRSYTLILNNMGHKTPLVINQAGRPD